MFYFTKNICIHTHTHTHTHTHIHTHTHTHTHVRPSRRSDTHTRAAFETHSTQHTAHMDSQISFPVGAPDGPPDGCIWKSELPKNAEKPWARWVTRWGCRWVFVGFRHAGHTFPDTPPVGEYPRWVFEVVRAFVCIHSRGCPRRLKSLKSFSICSRFLKFMGDFITEDQFAEGFCPFGNFLRTLPYTPRRGYSPRWGVSTHAGVCVCVLVLVLVCVLH